MNLKFKQSKLIALFSFMLAFSLVTGSLTPAKASAPGEGAYVGAFVGFGTGLVSGKVESFTTVQGAGRRGTFENDRGGVLGLSGIQGGGWLGYGIKTADDLYFGLEITAAASDEKVELTSSVGLQDDDGTEITSASAKRNFTTGGALRVGYYVNPDTLFALKGGVAVSTFDVKIGAQSEDYWAGGPQVGGSIETRLSKVDPNLSIKLEYTYTNYLTADVIGFDSIGRAGGPTGNNSEITGEDSAGRIGIQYSFGSLPSLW